MIENTGVDFQLLREQRIRYRGKISGLVFRHIVGDSDRVYLRSEKGLSMWVRREVLAESFELITA